MNPSQNSQKALFSLRLGGGSPFAWIALATMGFLQAAAPVFGFSPLAESVLEVLRGRIAAGSAGEEAYGAFLDLLAEGDEFGCEAWWARPEFMSATGAPVSRWEDMRFGEIRSALNEVCPEPPRPLDPLDPLDPPNPPNPPKLTEPPNPTESPSGRTRPARTKARLSVSQSVLPRRDRPPASPRMQGAGAWSRGAWSLSLEEYRARQRYLRLGSDVFSLHAGHVHPALARTRLGFVAGGRFYTDRSGASGAGGPLFSPQRALDGAGVSAALGEWNLEAAGAWNRLLSRDSVRRDALAYIAGIAREGDAAAKGAGVDFRFQSAYLRGETGTETPAHLGLAGLRLGGTLPGLAQWGLGAAASLPWAAATSATPGAYLETSLASPPSRRSSLAPSETASPWRLEARQATEHWANPLQTPRGILRDTLAGGWIVRGGGEGGLSSRTGFLLAAIGPWSAGLQGRMGAAWSLAHGLLAQSGSLGVTQAWDPWTLESGISLGWHRRGLPGAAAVAAASEGQADPDAGESGGFAQGVAWKRGPWSSKAAFMWRGGDYSGTRPAPLTLECRHGSWSARLYTGDIRDPGSYLRAEARQTWNAGERLKVEQEIRLPWTGEGLAADMGYQLRLEAAL